MLQSLRQEQVDRFYKKLAEFGQYCLSVDPNKDVSQIQEQTLLEKRDLCLREYDLLLTEVNSYLDVGNHVTQSEINDLRNHN